MDNNIGVDLGVSGSGAMNFLVDNNTFTDQQTNAILVLTGSTAAGTSTGTLSNNVIGDGTADSGAADQYGIQVEQRGAAIMAGAAELACPLSEPKSSGRGGLRRPALHSAGPQQPNNRESPRAIRRGYGCGRRV